MGSPLDPTLANIFLCYHETTWVNNCPQEFRPVYYRRYIDDVIVLFKEKTHVKKFLRYTNSRHKNIFTFVKEENNVLAFLDIKITRIDDKLITSIHRKKTFSGVYLNYHSYLPKEYKKGLLFTLLYRAYKLSSSYVSFHEEIQNLKIIWQKNSFPVYFIDKCVYKFLDKLFTRPHNVEEAATEKEKLLICLPFLGNISIQLKKQLLRIYKECLPDIKLDVIFRSKSRLKNAFLFKDITPRDLKSLVLYEYKCGICNDANYVGITKRHFIARGYEHLGVSVSTNNKLKFNKNNATAVRAHIHDLDHASSLEDIKIIGSASNDFHLKIKESLLILEFKPTLNTQGDSIPLLLFPN